ncbi:MAG: chemotaxis protein CheW [Gloeocapsa sp. DLM2.Bin57]|nr:MAG: chemotaxis protein CheW [Gloeocapsa sp. DLM2.Bin57]
MNDFSSFKSRRLRQQTNTNIAHFLTFAYDQNWFAISVLSVIKVITTEAIYGLSPSNPISLTQYQNQEIVVIDLAYLLGLEKSTNQTSYPYLLIMQLANQDLVGLPLVNPPVIQRVPTENIASLPTSYLTKNKIASLSSKIVKIPNSHPLFLLDTDKLNDLFSLS